MQILKVRTVARPAHTCGTGFIVSGRLYFNNICTPVGKLPDTGGSGSDTG